MSAKITRRTAARVLSVGAAALPGMSAPLFTPAQTEAVAALAEAIIPTTGTPGARGAKVHEYIERTLGGKDAQAESFLAGLQWIEDACSAKYGMPFERLDALRQTELLNRISDARSQVAAEDRAGAAFFRQLKVMVCNGYYLSRVGLEQEIRYRGNAAIHEYPPCRHRGE
jgi:hypothetical protein